MNDLVPEDYCIKFFESNFDAIFLTKPNGEIIRANPAACEMLGMTEKEICCAGRNGIVDTEDPALEVALKEREQNGKARYELNFIKKRTGQNSRQTQPQVFLKTKTEKRSR